MQLIPKIIELNKIGSSSLGYITFYENVTKNFFDIKRVYWTYYTPEDVERGGHAHKNLEQIIFALSGKIEFNFINRLGENLNVILDKPNIGIYIPPLIWRDIKFSHNAVLLCLASDFYNESDYIRKFDDFEKIINNK